MIISDSVTGGKTHSQSIFHHVHTKYTTMDKDHSPVVLQSLTFTVLTLGYLPLSLQLESRHKGVCRSMRNSNNVHQKGNISADAL